MFSKMNMSWFRWKCHQGHWQCRKTFCGCKEKIQIKGRKVPGKCHQWSSTKTSTEYCFKKEKTQLKGWEVSQEANAFYWIRRRKAVFTKACLQEKDSLWEVRLLLFLGKGWEEGENMSKHQGGAPHIWIPKLFIFSFARQNEWYNLWMSKVPSEKLNRNWIKITQCCPQKRKSEAVDFPSVQS